MRRRQFSLKTLLWLTAVVAVLLTASQQLKPPFYKIVMFGGRVDRQYEWRNGLRISISQGAFARPGIKIETGVDVSRWADE